MLLHLRSPLFVSVLKIGQLCPHWWQLTSELEGSVGGHLQFIFPVHSVLLHAVLGDGWQNQNWVLRGIAVFWQTVTNIIEHAAKAGCAREKGETGETGEDWRFEEAFKKSFKRVSKADFYGLITGPSSEDVRASKNQVHEMLRGKTLTFSVYLSFTLETNL